MLTHNDVTVPNAREIFEECKDTKAKLHACIIPWEDLDALSERESRAKGTPVDYKQMDRDNVLAIKDQLMEIEK